MEIQPDHSLTLEEHIEKIENLFGKGGFQNLRKEVQLGMVNSSSENAVQTIDNYLSKRPFGIPTKKEKENISQQILKIAACAIIEGEILENY